MALAEVKDDLSRFLRLAESEEILITRHGRPAGVLIGFETEEDWVDYRLEHHPEFLRRVAEARELFEEAMRLDPKERATLMRLLVDSLDAESEEGAEEAWRAEIERRIWELDSGQVQAVPWEELRARLYQR